MSRIFLSQAKSETVHAVAIRDWLAGVGWDDVFIQDDQGATAGQAWERALCDATEQCQTVIFLISNDWFASGWCRREYALARSLNKRLLAALVDPHLGPAEIP